MERSEFLAAMAERRSDEIVVYTMSTCTDWPKHSASPFNFFVGGAMGYASSIGLGIALAQPDRHVWAFDGDGSLLMNLGTTVTIPAVRPVNLVHFVLHNGVYELTGRVPTPDAGAVQFKELARAAGYQRTAQVKHVDELSEVLDALPDQVAEPAFIEVLVEPGPSTPMAAMQFREQGPAAAQRLAEILGANGDSATRVRV